MVRSILVLLAALAPALAAGCAQTPRTEVILVVDTDLRGPGGIDSFSVEVTSPEGDVQSSMRLVGEGQPPLPATLGLVHGGEGRLGLFTARVTGRTGGVDRVSRSARFTFQPGRTLYVRIDLLAQCIPTACGPEETCAAGGCRSVDLAPEELLEWTGTTPPPLDVDAGTPPADGGPPPDGGPPAMDGGPIDGGAVPVDGGPVDGGPIDSGPGVDSCVAAAETCNMRDDDCDGMVDDGFDLMTDRDHCGTCGTRCRGATGTCCMGTCQGSCP